MSDKLPAGFIPDGFEPDAAVVTGAHPEARIGAPSPDTPVTLADVMNDPVEAIARVGHIIGKDVSDPKLWLTVAASYFAPKVFGAVAPAVNSAARATMAGAKGAAPTVVKYGATAAGAHLGGPVGAVLGRTVGESIAERMNTPRPVAAPEPPPAAAPEPTPVPAPASPPRPVTTGTSMTPAPMPVRPAPAPVEPPPVAPAPAPAAVEPAAPVVAPGPKLSPQRAMNEIAIAARRAKTTLSAEDYDALKPLVQDGTPAADAVAALVKSRVEADPAAQFAARFNLPSDAERTFPPNKSGLPTKAPRADAKAKATAANGARELTPEVVRSAATDAGNRSMRAAGRTTWSEEDYRAATAEYNRLSK